MLKTTLLCSLTEMAIPECTARETKFRKMLTIYSYFFKYYEVTLKTIPNGVFLSVFVLALLLMCFSFFGLGAELVSSVHFKTRGALLFFLTFPDDNDVWNSGAWCQAECNLAAACDLWCIMGVGSTSSDPTINRRWSGSSSFRSVRTSSCVQEDSIC